MGKPVIHYSPEQIRQQLETAPAPQGKNHFWETWEDDLLKEFYGKRDTHVIAEKLSRTVASVQGRAGILGLTHKVRRE